MTLDANKIIEAQQKEKERLAKEYEQEQKRRAEEKKKQEELKRAEEEKRQQGRQFAMLLLLSWTLPDCSVTHPS